MSLRDLEERTFRTAKMGKKLPGGTWGDRAINEDAGGEGGREERRKGDCVHETIA